MKTLEDLLENGFLSIQDGLCLKKAEAVYIKLSTGNQEIFEKPLEYTLDQATIKAKEITMNFLETLFALGVDLPSNVCCEIGTMVIIESYLKNKNSETGNLYEKRNHATGTKKPSFVETYKVDVQMRLT